MGLDRAEPPNKPLQPASRGPTMTISESHASHIRRVRVDFLLEGCQLDPDTVTQAVGVRPSLYARQGDERRNVKGDVVGTHERRWWQLSSKDAITSKDINDHFRFLLDRLLSCREAILNFAEGGETFFGVLWESSYLYAGTGPVLDPECIAGVAALGAGMGFDI